MDLHVLKVGQQFSLPGRMIPPNFDGGMLEASPDAFWLLIYLSGMNENERKLLSKAKIATKVLESQEMLLSLIRFGDSPLIFELPFDPTLYADGRAIKLINRLNTLQLIGVESASSTIQVLRLLSIPHELRRRWAKSWEAVTRMPDASAMYSDWLDKLYAHYSVTQLWDMADYAGKLGEI